MEINGFLTQIRIKRAHFKGVKGEIFIINYLFKFTAVMMTQKMSPVYYSDV